MNTPSTPSLVAKWQSGAPYLLSVLRIVAAFIIMQHLLLVGLFTRHISAAGAGPLSLDAKRGK